MDQNMDYDFDEEEISELLVDPEEQADEEEVSLQEEPQNQKRGYRIPDQWTRVIDVDTVDMRDEHTHVISTDLMIAPNLPLTSGTSKVKQWAPLFFPKDFVKEHDDITMEGFKL